ncbi:MAG: DUF192 domain-containing protein, partial [Dehalococcoidia bacterium]
MRRLFALPPLLLIALALACGSSGDGPPAPDSTPQDLNNAGRIEVRLGSVVITAEPARTDEERSLGLGKRDSLGENEGMLF